MLLPSPPFVAPPLLTATLPAISGGGFVALAGPKKLARMSPVIPFAVLTEPRIWFSRAPVMLPVRLSWGAATSPLPSFMYEFAVANDTAPVPKFAKDDAEA